MASFINSTKTTNLILIGLIVVVVAGAGYWYWKNHKDDGIAIAPENKKPGE